jgi:glycogen debranching enzyme
MNIVENRRVGKIGMRTLDQSDYRYRSYYHNSEDNDDFIPALGFNYHNEPERVWLNGFFFRSSMMFRRGFSDRMKQFLANIKRAFEINIAFEFAELTNKDGSPYCDSCAWSGGAMLDVLYDFSHYSEDEAIN